MTLILLSAHDNSGQTNVNGQCGRCDGTQADTIGIYEFDINSEKVISRIFSAEGSTGIPAVSPSGGKRSNILYVQISVLNMPHFGYTSKLVPNSFL